MKANTTDFERRCANAIRFLAIDAVEKANSGHPGMPMGMADIAAVLWREFIRVNPKHPLWSNRDRFVLSNGHGAMLLYAVLHLSGFDLSIEDLRQFRQWHSKTPGHPEWAETPGVDTTTGPLGQGLANAVGMALAERLLAEQFNRPDFTIVDHATYAFVGDGCLMEGLSHEVASLAGTLGLGKLIVFYDDNGISIDGDVRGWFTDNTAERFRAYHWHVISEVDGHDPQAIRQAVVAARQNTSQPSLICCQTHIGFGAPHKVDTASCHGAPLGEEEVAATRQALDWPHPPFMVPDDIKAAWDLTVNGQKMEDDWNQLFASYESHYPELAKDFLRRQHHELPENWFSQTQKFIAEQQQTIIDSATRKASQSTLNHYAQLVPELVGGSADLSGSNCTKWHDAQVVNQHNFAGNYIEYGVREFGMSAMMNGMALHGGIIPFGGTFLTFSDYARNAVRLSALMRLRVIYVYSHDSIGVGEDGPTHQPIEHINCLRAMPGLSVWRPCDAVETAVAWQQAMAYQGPSCLLLSRQSLLGQPRDETAVANISKGGYVLWQSSSDIDAIILATGSEVGIAVQAAQQLSTSGVAVRVVAMPNADVFEQQSTAYQQQVLPPNITQRLAVEAGSPDYWYRWVGLSGKVIGIEQYGSSAPAKIVFERYGFTVSHIVEQIQALLTLHNVH